MAERAVRAIGLDVAGWIFFPEHHGELRAIARICEVNAAPVSA